jgi:putative membrane protein
MNRAVLLAAAAAAALSLAACQRKTTAPEAAAPETAAAPQATAPPPGNAAAPEVAAAGSAAKSVSSAAKNASATVPAALTSTEGLITGVTTGDMYQIEAGKIAEAKGQSPDVKAYGKMMVTDHGAMTNQMKHVFAATDVKVPTELDDRRKGMIASLNAASPADFDKLYLNQQQAAQEEELALLKGYAEGGDNKDLKPAAEKRVPKAQAHLDKLHELQAAQK